MTLAGLLVFVAAYALAVASPGPGIAALVARVLARGTRGVPAFVAGFVAGDLVWFAVAAGGLALVAQAVEGVSAAVRWAGAAYLAWLAVRFWTAPARPFEAEPADGAREGGWRLFATGFAITLGNPKAVVFFLALLPTVVDLPSLTLPGAAGIAAAMVAVLAVVLSAYALAAARARRLFRSARAVRALNAGAGAAMAGAAAVVATR
jgi:threonine/homoserine/homoserine lactone efflux protein